jgi:hypothetical protein
LNEFKHVVVVVIGFGLIWDGFWDGFWHGFWDGFWDGFSNGFCKKIKIRVMV